MSNHETGSRNWFDQDGQAYARFRPEYPEQLVTFLTSVSPDTGLAVDIGCGSGQLTKLLAYHYASVIGLDASADQLEHATHGERIRYQQANAEALPLGDHSVDLITCAQAAHWFDLPRFYDEVRRVCRDYGIVALIAYGVPTLPAPLNERFRRFYDDEIGPFWPAERKLVDSGYAALDFPFEEILAPELDIRLDWNLTEFLGYIATWSAVKRANEAGKSDILQAFAHEFADAWGDADSRRVITWPLNVRVGRVRAEGAVEPA